jgi:arabinan endo-1,5-alpha-L-arabinosidase
MTRQGNTYYVFCTSYNIQFKKSTDMHYWQYPDYYVFPSGLPAWIGTEFPGFSGSVWAPDISYFNGKYHLYYSVSATFGQNNSAIGLATNTTLNPSDSGYLWVDSGGPVIRSYYPSSTYNAIDPALFIDTHSTPTTYWLAFGSFWEGIKMRQIDPDTGYPLASNPTLYSIAQRPSPDAIEASFIVLRNGYYYLFVSFDYCCQGVNSTYNVRFGRSTSVTGTYYDRNGVSMMGDGGGTQLTFSDANWKGPGHNAVFLDNDGRYWLVHHAYNDPYNDGHAHMRIHELFWTPDGWPTLTEQTCADVHNLGYGLPADWIEDCYINFYDFAFLANDGLSGFDWYDVADLATDWLQCNNPQDVNCTW